MPVGELAVHLIPGLASLAAMVITGFAAFHMTDNYNPALPIRAYMGALMAISIFCWYTGSGGTFPSSDEYNEYGYEESEPDELGAANRGFVNFARYSAAAVSTQSYFFWRRRRWQLGALEGSRTVHRAPK
jgi:hypothetical protein